MRAKPSGHRLGEQIAVHGQRTACRQGMGVGHRHDQAIGGAHFPVQQADRILFVVVRAERVRADHFRQIAGLVGERANLGAHFVDHHRNAHVGGLPGGF